MLKEKSGGGWGRAPEGWSDLEKASGGVYLSFQSKIICAIKAKEGKTVARAGLLNLPASQLGSDHSWDKPLLMFGVQAPARDTPQSRGGVRADRV